MYIVYDDNKYPCTCRPGDVMVYRGLPDDFPPPVAGEIVLCADDGFVLRTDKAEDYVRQTFQDGVLTLTNAEDVPVEPVQPTAAEQREHAYNTEPVIEWEGEMLTVTQAAQMWQYYAAEGSAKAEELTVLISAAKAVIREKYPDEEVEANG